MLDFFSADRVRHKQYLLHKIETGTVSHKAYHANIRAVNVTRGNRQGNNAFNENVMLFGDLVPSINEGGPNDTISRKVL